MSSDWIEIQPDVCNGRPVLRGTRIAVQSVLEMLAAGDSVDDVLEAFPRSVASRCWPAWITRPG